MRKELRLIVGHADTATTASIIVIGGKDWTLLRSSKAGLKSSSEEQKSRRSRIYAFSMYAYRLTLSR